MKPLKRIIWAIRAARLARALRAFGIEAKLKCWSFAQDPYIRIQTRNTQREKNEWGADGERVFFELYEREDRFALYIFSRGCGKPSGEYDLVKIKPERRKRFEEGEQ